MWVPLFQPLKSGNLEKRHATQFPLGELVATSQDLTGPHPKWWFMQGIPPFQVGEVARGSSIPAAELGRQIEPRSPMEVEVLSRVRTSLVIVEGAVLPGKMLGHTLLHRIGDWPHGHGHLTFINAKCSAPAHGGGASVHEVEEEAFACRRMVFSDSSLERAVGAMGLGLTYAGIEPILKVEWMPKICQVLRCLTTEPVRPPTRRVSQELAMMQGCGIFAGIVESWACPSGPVSRSCSTGELGSMVKSWVGGWISCWSTLLRVFFWRAIIGRCLRNLWGVRCPMAGQQVEALVVMVIPGFGWVAHMVVVPCAPGCRGVWSSASWTGGLFRCAGSCTFVYSRKHREGFFRAEPLDELHRAKLHRAKLHRAKLHSAKLHRTKLHRAKLHKAKLHRAKLHRAKLHRAKLHRAKLHRAKLHRAKLHRAKLHRAKLHRA